LVTKFVLQSIVSQNCYFAFALSFLNRQNWTTTLTLTAGLNYIEPADGWVQVLPGDVLAYDATTALLSSRNATVPGFDPDFHCTIAGNSILKFNTMH